MVLKRISNLRVSDKRLAGLKGQKPKQSRFRVLIFGLVLPLLVIVSLFYYFAINRWIITSGRAVAEQVQVRAPMVGKISFIAVREGDTVQAGEPLFGLEDDTLMAAMEQAEAEEASLDAGLRILQSRLAGLKAAGIEPDAVSKVEAAQRDVRVALERREKIEAERQLVKDSFGAIEESVERAKRLYMLKAVSRAELNERLAEQRQLQTELATKESEYAEATATIEGATNILISVRARLEYLDSKLAQESRELTLEIEQADAAKRKIRSEIAEIRKSLEVTKVQSPISGIITWLPRGVGNAVDDEDVVVTIINPQRVWVEAYVDRGDLSGLESGRKAWVSFDGVRDKFDLEGSVSLFYPQGERQISDVSVGPDRAATPSRLAGLFHPIKITFSESFPEELRPEMIAKVWIARR